MMSQNIGGPKLLVGQTTVIEVAVTPRNVAPPLSPFQYGTQGGDWGSSICRGGDPKHCRTRATSMGASGATSVVVVVVSGFPSGPRRGCPCASHATPWTQDPVPSPNWL